MIVFKKSIHSGNTNEMDLDVTQEQIDAWEGGMLIQEAMPHLSVDEREFLMTGSTREDWDTMFPEEDEDEDDDDYEPEYDGQPDEAQEWHDFDPDC